jgi:alkanesulfonate monooxygenase SsuD/methylene tetrahydromethanopterin reductase-like flavin-dependent oxidoreductase (luciferase family)
MDANLCYGIPPITQRERYREAHDLIIKAWTSREMFSWNGKYQQLPMVNIWPRPIQNPHPPIWVPGFGSISTWEFAADNDHCYCFLSYFGAGVGKAVMDNFWEFVEGRGIEPNPHRAGFAQLVVVGETDADAEKKYAKHVEYFFRKSLHVPSTYLSPPGHHDYRSLAHSIRSGSAAAVQGIWNKLKDYSFKELADQQFVMAGSAESVRDQLRQAVRDLRIGNLMVLLPIGSMPHELVKENIDRFAEGVLPHLRGEWSEWENHWWPESLRAPRQLTTV